MKEIKEFSDVEIPDVLEKRITELTSQVKHGRNSNDASIPTLPCLMGVVEEESVFQESDEGRSRK